MKLLESARELWSGPKALRRERAIAESTAVHLSERLAELELALEDASWVRQAADGETEFSRDGLRRIISLSRLNFLKNPLIKRAVMLQVYYVFAQGMQVKAAEDAVNEIVQAFWDNPRNQAELTSHQALCQKEAELAVVGNIFFALFTNLSTGEVTIRTLPADEVHEIITNPEDSREPWFYRRTFTRQKFDPATGVTTPEPATVYYRDWLYKGPITDVNGRPVEETPIFHLKVGGLPGMRFGLPETYDALDWARAYKDFLSDWSTIVRSYARFAWQLVTKGGKNAIASAKQKLGTTIGLGTGSGSIERNPPPVAAAMFAGSESTKIEPIKTAGATTKAEDGRRLLLMVAASFGYPETFFGDVSVGTLATAKSLDRPTELKFRSRQTLWSDAIGKILAYVVAQSMEHANGGLAGVDPKATDCSVTISFPPILEHDITETVNALVAAATLNGGTQAGLIPPVELARMILTALGAQDVDELLDEIFPGGKVPDWMQKKIEGAADPEADPNAGKPGTKPGKETKAK